MSIASRFSKQIPARSSMDQASAVLRRSEAAPISQSVKTPISEA